MSYYKILGKEKSKMKFIHMADMHFDQPFSGLGTAGNLGDVRRLEQRKIFRKMIDYCKQNNVGYFLIAGDFYDHSYVRKSTIEYINQLFQEIPDTQIFIAPGNHDPYVKGSYYETFSWCENVHICKNEIEIVEDSKYDIYMSSFRDFHQEESAVEKIQIKHPEKINILLTHCDLNGARDENGFSYHPILESKINALGFDYVAMGHIHKTNFGEQKNLIYPGSPISFGFDEPGEHGMVVGEFNGRDLKMEFVKLDDRKFEKYNLLVDDIFSKEELIEKISNLQLDEKNLYEIVLQGNRQFEIHTREILQLIEPKNILKIKDKTEIAIDIEQVAKENNLRGIFVREIIQKYQEGKYTEQQIKKAIEIGLQIMS